MFQRLITGSALFSSLESHLFSSIAWPETLQNIFHQNDVPATEHNFISLHVTKSDSRKFWVQRCGFRIPATAFQSL